MNFYIGDPHLGHEAIIRLRNRPFADVDEMDEAIISNWNSRVTNGDTVFILGDMMFRNKREPSEYLKRLKDHKILVLGNHDASWIWRESATEHLTTHVSMMELIDRNRRAVLCHYPMLTWPNIRGGSYMVYGHLHGNREHDPCLKHGLNPRMLNSCVEVNEYQPVTNDEGETVIIEHEKNEGDSRFHLTTVQNNGWLRHNYIYKDGTREELFDK